MARWKTLITYLVQGNSAGIKTIELSNWVGKGIIIPRANLKEMSNRKEANNPAIYFLFWKNIHQQDMVYIGEAEILYERIATHGNQKDFWNFAIAFISKDNNLTKADIKYLEARAVQKTKEAKVFLMENSVEPKINNLPEYQIDTMEDFLDNIELLISFLGYPILTEVKIESLAQERKYICKWSAKWPVFQATWVYISEWFLVQKGSLAKIEIAKGSISDGWYRSFQINLLEKGVIKEFNTDTFIFLEDYIFNSPSSAASFILARSANGWTEWKTEEWKTLDEMERKSII